jgi:hypothetical protein
MIRKSFSGEQIGGVDGVEGDLTVSSPKIFNHRQYFLTTEGASLTPPTPLKSHGLKELSVTSRARRFE